MTERALLVRSTTSASGRYYAVGIEVPKVRVFDTLSGNLVSVVEAATGNMLAKAATKGTGLNAVNLSSVHFASAPVTKKKSSTKNVEAGLHAVVGTSDGTILIHDVSDDKLRHHVSVSDTQQPVSAIASAGQFVVAATANKTLAIVNIATGAVLLENIPIVRGVTAMDAILVDNDANTLQILCCGVQSILYKVHVPSHTSGNKMEKVTTTPSHTQAVSQALFVKDMPTVAITASAAEGTIRIWDVSGQNERTDRCRRVLMVGNRIAHVSCAYAESQSIVTATTFSGEVFVWKLRDIVPRLADSVPLRANLAYTSKQPQGRLLCCCATSASDLVLARGRYATPRFEGKKIPTTIAISGGRETVSFEKLPFLNNAGAGATSTANDDDAFDPMDCWASHEQMATLAGATAADEFAAPKVHREKDMKTLAKVTAPTLSSSAAIAGASVPLHQALHADDFSMVIELLHVAATTESSMAALVQSMRLPYLLKLLKILSDRVVTLGARHPLHSWVHCIMKYRGAELHRYERDVKATRAKLIKEEGKTEAELDEEETHSLPSTYIAPMMHHYTKLTELRDELSLLHGRMSIFNAVRPHNTTSSAAKRTVQFPNEFVDSKADDPENWKIVRIKRRAEGESRRSKKRNKKLILDTTRAAEEDEDLLDAGDAANERGAAPAQRLMEELGDEGDADEYMDSDEEGSEEDSEYSDEEGAYDDDDDSLDLDDLEAGGLDDDSEDLDGMDDMGGDSRRKKTRRKGRGARGEDDEDVEAADVEGVDDDEESDFDPEEDLEDDDMGDHEALAELDEGDLEAFSKLADKKGKKTSRMKLD